LSRQQFQQRTLDIEADRYTSKRGEPKIWFSSIKSLGEVLSENNVRSLKIMKDKKPETIAELSGRQAANLSQTVKNFERYGIVKLIK